jgi:hypothetical protein
VCAVYVLLHPVLLVAHLLSFVNRVVAIMRPYTKSILSKLLEGDIITTPTAPCSDNSSPKVTKRSNVMEDKLEFTSGNKKMKINNSQDNFKDTTFTQEWNDYVLYQRAYYNIHVLEQQFLMLEQQFASRKRKEGNISKDLCKHCGSNSIDVQTGGPFQLSCAEPEGLVESLCSYCKWLYYNKQETRQQHLKLCWTLFLNQISEAKVNSKSQALCLSNKSQKL